MTMLKEFREKDPNKGDTYKNKYYIKIVGYTSTDIQHYLIYLG